MNRSAGTRRNQRRRAKRLHGDGSGFLIRPDMGNADAQKKK